MTRKDYIKAAEIIRNSFATALPTKANRNLHWQMREGFVVFFAADNSRFDADRFRNACEVNTWT